MMIFTIFPQCGHLSLKTTSKALSRLMSSTLRLHTGHTPVSIIWLPFPVPPYMPGKRVSNIFHPCYKVLPGFYFLYSFAIKRQPDFQRSRLPLCMHYSFFGSHTAVTRLLHLGHFVVISTFPGESVPMSSRRPPHLGHLNCSIGYSSFSGIIFHPPLAVYAEREPGR